MDTDFRLFPERASTIAREIDDLYWALVGMATFFTVLICALIVVFVIRYREGARVNRKIRAGKKLLWSIEIGWMLVPLIIVMWAFAWGAAVFFQARRPPPDSLDVYVVGKQWMWKLQHEEGPREINALHVPIGHPVRLNMISEDVIHSFYIPAFRMKQDVLPGRYSHLWFVPSRPGIYHLFCAEYCGTNHSLMIGRVIAQTPDDYAAWISHRPQESPETGGRRVVQKFGCVGCHDPHSAAGGARGAPQAVDDETPGVPAPVRAPRFEGLYGRRVPLSDGRTVIADEQYIRESILFPNAKIVAGFGTDGKSDMPTFQGQICEEEIFQVIAYLKSLSGSEQPPQEEDPE